MSVFVFATPHLHLGILAKNVSGDGNTDDRRGLICFSGAGTCVGGTSDNQSGLIITPNFINSPEMQHVASQSSLRWRLEEEPDVH